MPEEYISLIKPPGYEVPGHTRAYTVPPLSKLSVANRIRHLTKPIVTDLTGMALAMLQEYVIESDFQKVFPIIADSIEDGNNGFLLRVNQYREPEGSSRLAPTAISLLGTGKTPIDALIKSMETPSWTWKMPGALEPMWLYKWCYKTSKPGAVVVCADVALGKAMNMQARKEVKRRRMAREMELSKPSHERALGRSKYIGDLVDSQKQRLREEGVLERIEGHRQDFDKASRRFSKAYIQYQQMLEDAASNAESAKIWGQINTVLGLLRTGAEFGERQEVQSFHESQYKMFKKQINDLSVQSKGFYDAMIESDQRIRGLLLDAGLDLSHWDRLERIKPIELM